MKMNKLTAYVIAALISAMAALMVVAVILLPPIIVIWALNQLGWTIDYTGWNVLAVAILIIAANINSVGFRSTTKEK